MKQYGIYIRCNGGTPYMIHFYDNILSAKQKLYDMIQLDEDRGRAYFVDNDFFFNKYTCSLNLKYYCIKERDVSEFTNYSEQKDNLNEKNKIIYFQNYKKNYWHLNFYMLYNRYIKTTFILYIFLF